jgi:hypothetical protein
MALREGRWDCPSCGSTAVRGRHVDCPGCGKPRPGGVRFYLTDDAPALVDPARLAEASAGPDWVCEHCGASSRAAEADCGGCGAPRGSSPTQRVIDYGPGQVPRTGAAPPAAGAPPSGVKKLAGGCLRLGCLGVLGLMLLGNLLAWLFPPVGGEDLHSGVVAAKRWERTVSLEARAVVAGEGWELPDSATRVRRERRVQRYDQVVDGYETVTRQVPRTERIADGTTTRTRSVSERVQTGTRTYVCGHRDRGNGYFEDVECSEPEYETRTRTETYEEPRYRTETYYESVTEREPVYRRVPVRATYYRYRVPRWSPSRTVRAAGDTTAPHWPAFEPARSEREAGRTQTYQVDLRDARTGRVHTLNLPNGRWLAFRPGQRVALRVEADSVESLPADSLSACRRWHRDGKPVPADSLGCSPPPPKTP